MKATTYLWAASILLIMSCSSRKQTTTVAPSKEEAVPVQLISLTAQTLPQTIEVTGYLGTEDMIRLSFKTGGVIEKIYVKEGDKIRKGQLIASIRPTEINAITEQAALGLQKAERDYARVKSLYQDSVATLEQMQNVKTALDVARQQVSQARFNQGFIRLTAPEDGFVLRKLKNDGELSEPGGPVIILGSLTTKQSWVLHAAVSDKEWTMIQQKDTAIVEFEAFPNKRFNAIVSKKSIVADPTNGAFSVDLDVQLNGVEPANGMFGKAKIQTKYIGKGFVIPYTALVEANGKQASVFISQDGKTVKRVKVELGEMNNDHVLVVSGLDSAAYIVSSGSPYLREGSTIQPIK